MKKIGIFSYILGLVVAAVFTACESNETYEKLAEARPGDTIYVNKTTKVRIDALERNTLSGMVAGAGWQYFDGVFVTSTPDADDPMSTVETETKVGGVSRSDGRVQLPVIECGEEFIDPVFELTSGPDTADVSNTDSIGSKVAQLYSGSDGQKLNLDDVWSYVAVGVTEAVPHYEPSSTLAANGIRYEYDPADPNVRVVWVKVQVAQNVVGTTQGTNFNQYYEIGYQQTKNAAVEPEKDPYEVRIKDFQLFRTYRKKTQHSICEGFLSFGVYNTKTGELVEEIVTDQFSMQLGKTGHFGAPTNGYIVGEARLIGSAPTAVTETEIADNEEALTASHQAGNFNVTVSCTAQDYYVHFPVRGRDDSEGGMAAGGQNLFFHATLTYTRPATATEPAWTKTWSFTHKTDVNVIGWEVRTPAVDRTGEVVNDVDGQRKLQYAKSFVVEFVNHLYLDGEEIVQVVGDDDFYYPISKAIGSTVPFHTSDMVIDCWTSYLP
jgi:hypothetical protein